MRIEQREVSEMCMMMNHGFGHESPGGHQESPLDILKRRFAAGEITRDEYEEMKRVLLEDDGPQHGSHGAH